MNKLINLSWIEIAFDLKLLDDFTELNNEELNYRHKIYKDFSLKLKQEMMDIIETTYGWKEIDYDFDEEYKDAFEEYKTAFEEYRDNTDPNKIWNKEGIAWRYNKLRTNFEYIKDFIQNIESEINKRNEDK